VEGSKKRMHSQLFIPWLKGRHTPKYHKNQQGGAQKGEEKIREVEKRGSTALYGLSKKKRNSRRKKKGVRSCTTFGGEGEKDKDVKSYALWESCKVGRG